MPPRRQKVELKRIDAALDTLVPMGFSREVVCMMVDKLLEAYGPGDGGWSVIEKASYKLLIDAISEDQESSDSSDTPPARSQTTTHPANSKGEKEGKRNRGNEGGVALEADSSSSRCEGTKSPELNFARRCNGTKKPAELNFAPGPLFEDDDTTRTGGGGGGWLDE